MRTRAFAAGSLSPCQAAGADQAPLCAVRIIGEAGGFAGFSPAPDGAGRTMAKNPMATERTIFNVLACMISPFCCDDEASIHGGIPASHIQFTGAASPRHRS